MFSRYFYYAKQYGIKNLAKEVKAEFDVGRIAVGIIVAVVVIVIAVSLIPTVMTGVATGKSGGYNVTTYNSTGAKVVTFHSYASLFPSAITLEVLIPLIFVAGIVIIVLYMLFTKK